MALLQCFAVEGRVTRGQKERDLKLAALYVNQVENASDDG